MFQKIAKHRANDASNDVHRPPIVINSLALAVLVLTCLCVITIALLSSASIDDQLSLTFDHFQ